MRTRVKLTVAPLALAGVTACAAVTGLGDYELVADSADAADAADANAPMMGDAAVHDEMADASAPAVDADILVDGALDALDARVDANVDAALPPVVECDSGTNCDVITSSIIIDLATSSDAIYWIDTANNVSAARLDGTGAHVLVAGETGPLSGVEVTTGGFLYWGTPASLRRVPIAGGAATTIASLNAPAGCLKEDGSRLNIAEPTVGVVGWISFDGTQKGSFLSNASNPIGVVVDGNDVFFTTNNGANGEVREVINGVPSSFTLTIGQKGPRCMSFADSYLWWGNRDSGELMKMKETALDRQVVTSGQSLIHGIGFAGKYIFWSYSGGIRRRTLQ